jgi:hypothetical protein
MYGDENWDWETPLEDIPGYVGIVFDDLIEFSEGLMPLIGFDFCLYGRMADELDVLKRYILVDFGLGPSNISFEAHSIQEIISCIPCVASFYDCPPNQGPGSGSGYIFLLNEGSALTQAKGEAQALRNALDEDFEILKIKLSKSK